MAKSGPQRLREGHKEDVEALGECGRITKEMIRGLMAVWEVSQWIGDREASNDGLERKDFDGIIAHRPR